MTYLPSFEHEPSEIQQLIPDVEYSALKSLTPEDINHIKERGCVVIRNVVDTAQAVVEAALGLDVLTCSVGIEGVTPAGKVDRIEYGWFLLDRVQKLECSDRCEEDGRC